MEGIKYNTNFKENFGLLQFYKYFWQDFKKNHKKEI